MRAYLAVASVCALMAAGSLAAADRTRDEAAIYKSRRQVMGEVDSAGNELPSQTVNLARIFVNREGQWLLAAWFAMPVSKTIE